MSKRIDKVSKGCEGYFLADIHEDGKPTLYNQLFTMAFNEERIGANNQFSIMFPKSPYYIEGIWSKDSGFKEKQNIPFSICSEFCAKDFQERYIRLKKETYKDSDFIKFMDRNVIDSIFAKPSLYSDDKTPIINQLHACESILLAANQIENYIRVHGIDNVLINENLKAVKYFASIMKEVQFDYLFFWECYSQLLPNQENFYDEILKLDKKLNSKNI